MPFKCLSVLSWFQDKVMHICKIYFNLFLPIGSIINIILFALSFIHG